jgi:hypothetical protein
MTQTDLEQERDVAAGTREPETWGWTPVHRAGIGILLLAFLGVLVFALLRRTGRVDDPVVVVNGAPVELPVNMDPNSASAGALSRIPGVGEKIAAKIVDYREIRKAEAAGGVVYRKLEDLTKAAGITNKKTIEACRTFMVFPDEPEASPRGLKAPGRVSEADAELDGEQ